MRKVKPKPNCVVNDDTHDWGGQLQHNMIAYFLEYDVSSQEHMSKVAPAITGK